jgi:hypothetical protein
VPGDGGDLLGRGAALREPPHLSLPKPMREALGGQASRRCSALHEIGERPGRDGPAIGGNNEVQAVRRAGLEGLQQVGVHRDGEGSAGLLLHDRYCAAGDVRPAHPYDIAGTLRGVKQQRIREPLPRAEEPSMLKRRQLGVGPRVVGRAAPISWM